MQLSSSRFRTYMLPFFFGSLIGVGLYFAGQETGLLATSIGGTPVNQERISDVHLARWDEGSVSLVASKDLPAFTTIQMILSFDPEAVSIEAKDIVSDYKVDAIASYAGQFVITLHDTPAISEDGSLLTIHTLGDAEQSTLSDLSATLADGTTTPLVLDTESF